MLADFRLTVDGSPELSASVRETLETADTLMTGIAERRHPDARPLNSVELRETAESTTQTMVELNEALASIHELLSPPAQNAGASTLTGASRQVSADLEQLVDQAYRRGLTLIAALIVGSLAAVILYRAVFSRMVARRRAG